MNLNVCLNLPNVNLNNLLTKIVKQLHKGPGKILDYHLVSYIHNETEFSTLSH